MLVIRAEQVTTLKESAIRSFEHEMAKHLAEFSPPLFNTMSEEQLRKAVRFGIDRAGEYGFTFRGPIRLYLESMLLFGSYYDTDPQYPWAREILAGKDEDSQMQRANMLYEKVIDYREKVAGPEDKYALEALENIAALARRQIMLSSQDFIPGMLLEIEFLYPQKSAYIGDKDLEILIRKGADHANELGFPTPRGAALLVMLMLAFGHGCAADPLYPWIEKTLADEAITDPEARARRLESKALTWLNHVLEYFRGGVRYERS